MELGQKMSESKYKTSGKGKKNSNSKDLRKNFPPKEKEKKKINKEIFDIKTLVKCQNLPAFFNKTQRETMKNMKPQANQDTKQNKESGTDSIIKPKRKRKEIEKMLVYFSDLSLMIRVSRDERDKEIQKS